MSTISDIEVRLVEHGICEVTELKQGNIKCADNMLNERACAMNRLFSLKCLIAEDDSANDDLISHLYEQIKEIVTKLNIKI